MRLQLVQTIGGFFGYSSCSFPASVISDGPPGTSVSEANEIFLP
jgi:hypothetical protein